MLRKIREKDQVVMQNRIPREYQKEKKLEVKVK